MENDSRNVEITWIIMRTQGLSWVPSGHVRFEVPAAVAAFEGAPRSKHVQ